MTLVLLRHAEKAGKFFAENPPLSDKGLRQAQNLLRLIQDQEIATPRKIFVSPLQRTQQTAAKVAEHLNLPLQISKELHERQENESIAVFQNRVSKYLKWLPFQEGPAFVVTHFDWLEEAMKLIPSTTDLAHEQYSCWTSAQYMQFEINDGLWLLEKQGRASGG